MPVIVQTTTSKVSGLWGRAYIRDSNGKLRLLKMDEIVVRGDVILTEQNAIVKLDLVDSLADLLTGVAPRAASGTPAAERELSRVIGAGERGDVGVSPAAGVQGGEGGDLQPGLRVERVVETVDPAGLRTTPIAREVQPLESSDERRAQAVLPSASVNDVSANEGAGFVTFTVTLDAASATTVSIDYSLVAGSAAATADFAANGGTLSFAPGVTSLTITVPVSDDRLFEGSESFIVNLSNAVNASVGDGVGQGTIEDNDTAPRIAAVARDFYREG